MGVSNTQKYTCSCSINRKFEVNSIVEYISKGTISNAAAEGFKTLYCCLFY